MTLRDPSVKLRVTKFIHMDYRIKQCFCARCKRKLA